MLAACWRGSSGKRIQGRFKIFDIADRECARLARVRQNDGPNVGKHQVNLEGLDSAAFNAIENAVQTESVVICR